MMILRYHEIFQADRCPGMAASAVSLKKSHDIVILSICNIVKGQAKYIVDRYNNFPKKPNDLCLFNASIGK